MLPIGSKISHHVDHYMVRISLQTVTQEGSFYTLFKVKEKTFNELDVEKTMNM